MKNIFLICFTLIFSTSLFAQVNRTGSFVANMPAVYPCSGDVTLENNGGTITVDFDNNFSTIQGITLEVFLSTDNVYSPATDVKISTTPLDAGSPTSTPINGAMTFNVPAGVNAYEYDNVLIQCTSASILWGHANMCDKDINITSSSLPSDTYRSEETIRCSSSLSNSADIIFEASNYIQLESGFTVPMTTEFSTFVGMGYGCSED